MISTIKHYQPNQAPHSERGAVLVFTIVLMIGVFAILAFCVNISLLSTSSRQQYANAEYVAQAALLSLRQGAVSPSLDLICLPITRANCVSETGNIASIFSSAVNLAVNTAGRNSSTLAKSRTSLGITDALIAPGNASGWLQFGICTFQTAPNRHLVQEPCNWMTPDPFTYLQHSPGTTTPIISLINAARVVLPPERQQLLFTYLGTSEAMLGGGTATVVYDARRDPNNIIIDPTNALSNPSKDIQGISTNAFIVF